LDRGSGQCIGGALIQYESNGEFRLLHHAALPAGFHYRARDASLLVFARG